VLVPALEDPVIKASAVIGFIILTTIVNLVGMRTSVGTLGVMTVVKLVPLVALIIFGLATRDPAVGFAVPQFGEFESVVLLTFYAYMAFENATFAAGEMRNPQRTLPLALMTTLGAVAVFYMVVIWAYLAIAPEVTDNENALSAAAEALVGQTGAIVIAIAAAVSICANTLRGGIVTPRMTFGMAEQGLLPGIFAHVSRRFQTPDVSILFYGGIAVVFSLWAGFATLAVASTLSRLVMYLLAALLAAASTLWVASHAKSEAYEVFGFLLVVGTGLYFLSRRRSVEAAQAV